MLSIFVSLLGLSSVVTAGIRGQPRNAFDRVKPRSSDIDAGYTSTLFDRDVAQMQARHARRQTASTSPYLNNNTEQFVVDGTGVPDINFDIGESYAGLLPISDDPNEKRQLYFWFFPSNNSLASNEITIWYAVY